MSSSSAGGVLPEKRTNQDPVLFSLGHLLPAQVIKRPSATVRTPYVADVVMEDAQSVISSSSTTSGAESLVNESASSASSTPVINQAHTPSLGCQGMCEPGQRQYVSPARSTGGKTQFSVWLSEALPCHQPKPFSLPPFLQTRLKEPAPDVFIPSPSVVGTHPSLAERIVSCLLEQHLLDEVFGRHARIRQQVSFGKSRVDFVAEYDDEEGPSQLLIEVKNVPCRGGQLNEELHTLGRTRKERLAARDRMNARYSEEECEQFDTVAVFPFGELKRKINVVSERAIKHIIELTTIQQEGAAMGRITRTLEGSGETGDVEKGGARDDGDDKASETIPPKTRKRKGRGAMKTVEDVQQMMPTRAAIIFVVNRGDCGSFSPGHQDALFAQVLYRAQQVGVTVLAVCVEWQWRRRPIDGVMARPAQPEIENNNDNSARKGESVEAESPRRSKRRKVSFSSKDETGAGSNNINEKGNKLDHLGRAEEWEMVYKGTLPVVFDESVCDKDIDEEFLQRVLQYNADFPNGR